MIIAIVGASATGKSSLAHALAIEAPRRGGRAAEIVSMDAFSLYRGMDIGTAKPSTVERREIPYHQVDVLDIDEVASVARYQQEARRDVAAIEARDHQVIAVGGSGLYVRALLDEMEFPGTDPDIRRRLEQWAGEVGYGGAHARLAALDPTAAEQIDARNTRRVVRALEVIELTGRPFSASLPRYQFVQPTLMIGVRRDEEEMEQRIERRTRAMFTAGFLDEVRELRRRGLQRTITAIKATGYASAIAVLDGELREEQAIAAVAADTVKLTKRQWKWFRRDPRIEWIDATGMDDAALVDRARQLVDRARDTTE